MGSIYRLIRYYVCLLVLQLCNSQVLNEIESIHEKIYSMERKIFSLEMAEQNHQLTINQLHDTLAQQQASITDLHEINILHGDEISDLRNRVHEQSTKTSELKRKLRTQEFIIKQQSKNIASIRKVQNSLCLKISMHSEEKRSQSPASFMALLTTTRSHLGVDQVIIFNTAPLNEGGVYNILHGIFTAPQAGIYIFSTTLVIRSHGKYNHTNAALVRNGHHVAILYAQADTGIYGVCSQTAILQLNQGDDVWVSNTQHTDNEVYGDSHSTFSGALLTS